MEQVVELLLSGNKKLFAGKYREAIEDYNQGLEIAPEHSELLFRRGHAKSILSDRFGGMEDINQALLLDPGISRLFGSYGATVDLVAKPLNSRACRYIEEGNFEAAFKDLERALELKPQYDMAMLTMAEAYVAMGEHEQAIEWLEKASAVAPHNLKEIDTYDCYAPLRSNARYQTLINGGETVKEANTTSIQPEIVKETNKSFYLLEMAVSPGGIRESLRFASDDLEQVEAVLLANLKGNLGFYKLLSYGQTLSLHRIEKGQKIVTLNMLPFISVKLPQLLTASFSEAGKLDLRNLEGGPMPLSWEVSVTQKHKRTGATYEIKERRELSKVLWNYHGFSISDETVFLTDYRDKIGVLSGEILQDGENDAYFGVTGGQITELESGETLSAEEYIRMMKEDRL